MASEKLSSLVEIFEKAGLLPEWLERDRIQGREQGREKSYIQGYVQGCIQALVIVFKNALNKDLPIDVIHDITGLDVEAIKKSAEEVLRQEAEQRRKMVWTYKNSRDHNLIIGTSKILNLEFRSGEKIAKIRGQLQTLFGNPVYTGPNAENAYSYVIIMENDQGDRYIFNVYLGNSGTSIGGNTRIKGIEDAALELKQYIAKAYPSDYEYQGKYPNGDSLIMGVKDGEPYYSITTKRKTRKKRKTFEEIFTEAGIIPEWIERGRVEGLAIAARNALGKGLPIDVIHDITGLDVETIKKNEPIIERVAGRKGLEAYLYVVITENPRAFLEARETDEVEKFDNALTEAGLIPDWLERGREESLVKVARNAMSKGLPIDVIHDITGLHVEKIHQLTAAYGPQITLIKTDYAD